MYVNHVPNISTHILTDVAKLQQPDGSFVGDQWGEIDTRYENTTMPTHNFAYCVLIVARFTYCAVNCLAILGKLDLINKEKAVEFIVSCKNFDGAFGCYPGAESHAGHSMYQQQSTSTFITSLPCKVRANTLQLSHA